MRRPIQSDDIRNPSQLFDNLVMDYVEGALDETRVLYRATVVAVDNVGSQFESEPPNPKHSIKARIITNGYNSLTSDDDLPIFWPLFSHVEMPIKEREHVYVLFEDENKTHGLWLTRISEPLNVDNKNYVAGTKKYTDITEMEAESVVQGTDTPSKPSLADDFVTEDVPPLTARAGDHVLHGSNNAVIVLGRDRPADLASGEKEQAGTIDLVAGRVSSEHMDTKNDKARVYVSAKTDVDVNFGTDNIGEKAAPSAAIIAVGDEIRIIARNGAKIVVLSDDGTLTLDAPSVHIGNQALEPAVFGDKLRDWLNDLLSAVTTKMVMNTPAGPTAPGAITISGTEFIDLKSKVDSLVSSIVKVK